MRDRARSMSDSIFTIAFAVLMAIIYLRDNIFRNDPVVRLAGWFITGFTVILSIIGIILWMYEHAKEFIETKIFPMFLTHIPNFVHVSGYLISISGYLMVFTSFAFLVLFKQNHYLVSVRLLGVASVFCYIGFMCKFNNQEGQVEVLPDIEKKLQHLLELAGSITNILFCSLIGSTLDMFRASKPATNGSSSTASNTTSSNTTASSCTASNTTASSTTDSDIDLPLLSYFFGSLLGIYIMVLMSVAYQHCPTKIIAAKFLLVIVILGCVLTGTWELLGGFVLLQVLPLLVILLAYLWKVFYHPRGGEVGGNQDPHGDSQDPHGDSQDPVTLSFTSIAFAGLAAAIAFTEKNKTGDKFKFHAFFSSTALVSSVIWRLLTHENDPDIKMFAEISCGVTLVLLSATVVTSLCIVWG